MIMEKLELQKTVDTLDACIVKMNELLSELPSSKDCKTVVESHAVQGLENIISSCKKSETPVLIKRCLAYGVEILPYQLETILSQYKIKKVDDDSLNKFDRIDLVQYVDGLCLSGQEMAREWSKGHEILKGLGFVEKVRKEGHRSFVSLVYEAN